MPKKIAIGIQDFEELRKGDYFYIDKTNFIKEWLSNGDVVTLITRPRRFGKTLNMDMMYKFLSIDYAGRNDLFEGLSVWEDEIYRELQGTYPVIFLSFAKVKSGSFETLRRQICHLISELYQKHHYLTKSDVLTEQEKKVFMDVTPDMDDALASFSLGILSNYMEKYYKKKVIILLDEYDTPLQEAWLNGYWNEMSAFIRSLFNSAFKTNPHMYRSILTGITRVGKESMFSDLNNPEIVSTTSEKYADCFGFTEAEVFNALDEFGLSDKKQEVKEWYDGFTFGEIPDIYNPWSITHYLNKKKFDTYWANTSDNALVSKLIQSGSSELKMIFENLMKGNTLKTEIDEQVVFNQLDSNESAVWSLLLATGYLKVKELKYTEFIRFGFKLLKKEYTLEITNNEIRLMFISIISGWFNNYRSRYNDFISSLLENDVESMNAYMNDIALNTFSYFDTGKEPSKKSEPEKFYHGFVLGLMVDMADDYAIISNRESGRGRYDVMLEPLRPELDGIIIEFKVIEPKDETNLEATADAALAQIEQKKYEANLIAKGIPPERIRKYGFAFEGKRVLIKEGDMDA